MEAIWGVSTAQNTIKIVFQSRLIQPGHGTISIMMIGTALSVMLKDVGSGPLHPEGELVNPTFGSASFALSPK
jgi:hypothetical protein